MVRRTSLKTVLFSGAAFATLAIAGPAAAQSDPAEDSAAADTEVAHERVRVDLQAVPLAEVAQLADRDPAAEVPWWPAGV